MFFCQCFLGQVRELTKSPWITEKIFYVFNRRLNNEFAQLPEDVFVDIVYKAVEYDAFNGVIRDDLLFNVRGQELLKVVRNAKKHCCVT